MAKLFDRALLIWFVVSGGLSGLLIGTIVIELVSPGHPFYREVHLLLRGLLGLQ